MQFGHGAIAASLRADGCPNEEVAPADGPPPYTMRRNTQRPRSGRTYLLRLNCAEAPPPLIEALSPLPRTEMVMEPETLNSAL